MTPIRMRLTAAAGMAALALGATGCGLGSGADDEKPAAQTAQPAPSATPTPSDEPPARPSGSPGTPKGGIPKPADVDEQAPEAVARGALTAYYTYDTKLDRSRNDAGRRMADSGWCTDTYAQELRAAAARSAPGASWDEWSRHQAYATVKMTPADEAGKPDDTPTSAFRTFAVTVTPHGRDGWTGKPEVSVAYVELSRSAPERGWRISEVTLP